MNPKQHTSIYYDNEGKKILTIEGEVYEYVKRSILHENFMNEVMARARDLQEAGFDKSEFTREQDSIRFRQEIGLDSGKSRSFLK